MKKIVTTLLCFVAAVACAIGFAACKAEEKTGFVEGKTFECYKAEMHVVSGFTDEEKEKIESSWDENIYLGVTLDYGKDGKCILVYKNGEAPDYIFSYKQEGDEVSMTLIDFVQRDEDTDRFLANVKMQTAGKLSGKELSQKLTITENSEDGKVIVYTVDMTLKQVTKTDNGEDKEDSVIDVAGKTFVFVKIYGEFPDDISDEVKAEANNNFAITTEAYKDVCKFVFGNDGTWKQTFEFEGEIEEVFHGTYTQSGSEIEMKAEEDSSVLKITISGDILIMRTQTEGFTQVQEFKLK